ncbi:MAG: uroporphyrinogen-III synthase [Acetobacteraceae bacterium]|nr:uroporphyrinogen-III synthase [Acetobacteraceae bacterium]
MKPLAGIRIVVTRAVHQAEELAKPLRDRGAEVILLPAIAIAPPDDAEPLRAAAVNLAAYDWIIFTSANAVSAFREALQPLNRQCDVPVAVVGNATREAAEESGFRVERAPEHYVAESLVEAFGHDDLTRLRILIPSAAATRDVVAPALRERGAHVDVIIAYQNAVPPDLAERAREVFQPPLPDWITFASPSAVTNLVNTIGSAAMRGIKIASIGPITSEAVFKRGLTVAAEARVHTVDGLLAAILDARLN